MIIGYEVPCYAIKCLATHGRQHRCPYFHARLSNRPIQTGGYMYYLYAIYCEQNTIYIGVTQKLHKRLKMHFNGDGSSVTKRYKPLCYVLLGEFMDEQTAKDEERSTVLALRNEGNLAYGAGYSQSGRYRTTGQIPYKNVPL